jgi:hypothetical protein
MKYVFDMHKGINYKDFLTEVEFMNIDREIKKVIIESFVAQIKSKNAAFVEHLKQILDIELMTEYISFHTKNEKRKENTAKKTIEMCINLHKEKLENFIEEQIFGKTSDFEKILTEAKILAINEFKIIFDEDSESSKAHYLLKV